MDTPHELHSFDPFDEADLAESVSLATAEHMLDEQIALLIPNMPPERREAIVKEVAPTVRPDDRDVCVALRRWARVQPTAREPAPHEAEVSKPETAPRP